MLKQHEIHSLANCLQKKCVYGNVSLIKITKGKRLSLSLLIVFLPRECLVRMLF